MRAAIAPIPLTASSTTTTRSTCGGAANRDPGSQGLPGNVHCGRHLVSAVANGLEQLEVLVAQLRPQPAHQDADGPVDPIGAVGVGQLEELVAREHPPRPVEEDTQQIELGAGQVDIDTVNAD